MGKVKLILCLIKHHRTKAYGEVQQSSTHSQPWHLIKASGQLHVRIALPHPPPQKKKNNLDASQKKNLLSQPVIKPQILGSTSPQSSHYTD
jgi:hypothetical protein